MPKLEKADKRFFWNNYLLSNFCKDHHEFCVPVIHGCKSYYFIVHVYETEILFLK